MRKKKIMRGLVAGLVLWVVLSVSVMAAYSADIAVLETSGVAYTMYPLSTSLNVTNLVDQNYITASGLDTRVMEGVNPKPHMLAHDRVLFADNVLANSTSIYQITTGNGALSDYPILVGYDGYIIMDDAVALEPTNNFEFELTGYIDTTVGNTKRLIYKEEAFITYIQAADSIRAAMLTRVGAGFPQVDAVNGGNEAAAVANHTVNLPAGIIAGDLLIVLFTGDGNPVITFPAGWTVLYDVVQGVAVRGCTYYRIADGTEGATITVTTAPNVTSAHTSYRISAYSGVPEVGVATTAIGHPDPPNLAPSWGALNTLWLATAHTDNGARTVAAYPAGYINGRNDIAAGAIGCTTGSAERDLNAAAENPGVFTMTVVTDYVANTIAIAPAFIEGLAVTAINVPSGPHKVNVRATGGGGNFIISVDDAVAGDFYDSVALAGSTVANTPTDWVLMQNNVSSDWDYYEHNVAGVLIVDYEPVNIILGMEYTVGTAAFVNGNANVVGTGTNWDDRMVGSLIRYDADDDWHIVSSVTDATNLVLTAVYAGAGGGAAAYTMAPRLPDKAVASVQDGIITWGSNSVGIQVIIGSFESDFDTTIVTEELVVPDVLGETNLPPDAFLRESEMTGTGISPFYPIVNWLAQQTDTPIQWLWWSGGGVFVLVAIVVVFSYTQKLLHSGVAGCVAIAFCVAMSVFPWWMLIPAVFIVIGLVVMERTPTV